MATVQEGDLYFEEVLHNSEWVDSDVDTKTRALKTAERNLVRLVPQDFEIPSEAIFEQAITLLRVDEGFLKAQLGTKSTAVSGISITYDLDNVKMVNGIPISQLAIGYIEDQGGTVKGQTRVGRYWL